MSYEQMKPYLKKNPDLVYVEWKKIASNSEYQGQLDNYKRHGFGINKWKSGAVYLGDWKNDKTNGKGTFWHANGDTYIGEFVDD